MPTHSTSSPQDLSALVHKKERLYHAVMLAFSAVVYGSLALMVVNVPATGGVVLGYGVLFALLFFMMHGLMLGNVRGNGVRVTATQFPTLHATVARHAEALGLKKAPDVFLLQAGGLLNAFATRFLGRDFVVLYSDVLAMAEKEGQAVVGWIIAHELAHVRRGHLRRRWMIMPGRLIPYLGAAYSRACEYTCDRFAAHCQPDGAVDGLLALAAGPELYRRVDAREFAEQVQTEGGFWVRRAELLASHPTLPKRVAAVIAAGANVPAYSPVHADAPAWLTSA
ncbi:MAG: M48 family metallopeptidase [Gemmatimonadaceae bacterium]|nr:M48 family metallopeptidase [Gemmatimonadaceae bacterium]NUO93477.1 M48 family metallopeptidase [Gemmatimonadaceae bacterium]NUP55435.1 M48 family metallopeptidase [Gemmatimonadaceae bacterium]NUR35768.1 M48 family metallopeptidase [Gemmatimonadaceae bacterium]NUS32278.1 M48 family metallopeptidase [Gemmatimonadaceae bacterium]